MPTTAVVEGALCTHPDVLEAAVVGWQDEDKLIKPKAIVVLKSADKADEELARGLKEHVKIALAPYKYPRWIEFRKELRRRRLARSSVSSSEARGDHCEFADARAHRIA